MTTDYRRSLLAKLHIMITQQGVDKQALYSSFGVTTARDLTDDQIVYIIRKLEGEQSSARAISSHVKAGDEVRRLRSEVLCLLTWSPAARNERKRGLGVPNDWAVLNPFIERHAGRLLNRLSMDELQAFKMQLLSMRAKGWIYRNGNVTTQMPIATAEPKPQPTEPPIFISCAGGGLLS